MIWGLTGTPDIAQTYLWVVSNISVLSKINVMIFCSNIPNELLSKISKILSMFDELLKLESGEGFSILFQSHIELKKMQVSKWQKTLHLQCRYTQVRYLYITFSESEYISIFFKPLCGLQNHFRGIVKGVKVFVLLP